MIVGLGVDVVDIDRLRKSLQQQGERFIQRVYTPAEQEFCEARQDPGPHYAARFAAKEALFKAIGTGWDKGVSWQDVEVHRQDRDPPILIVTGEAKKRSEALGTKHIFLSLSHTDSSAVAVVILER